MLDGTDLFYIGRWTGKIWALELERDQTAAPRGDQGYVDLCNAEIRTARQELRELFLSKLSATDQAELAHVAGGADRVGSCDQLLELGWVDEVGAVTDRGRIAAAAMFEER